MEDRKLKEVEHSRTRRTILQGFERHSDTVADEKTANLDELISDQKAFDFHFSNVKYYSIIQASENYEHSWFKSKCRKGLRILDFGCGNGENGLYAAQCGAETEGIDISPEGVANANLNASQAGLADHCHFKVMDGENMTFPDSTFDLAVEYGALHHVDLDKAMSELCRVLKPDGEMICVEALRHNPLIHWYRTRTMHLRTQWEVEHILSVKDLDIVRKYFQEVEVKFFHLAVLAAVPLRKTPLFKPLRALLNGIDAVILTNKWIGKYAWQMIFIARKPRKRNDDVEKNL
ncbi:MAG: class I SAM-dependent methyltransferase [Verrucomicrobia bacterium]|nr:class I SAM-dependent methyltransferase [Verrucomicrobiota bacterium]